MDTDALLGEAVKHFWKTRAHQRKRQGGATGRKDAGNRAAVTGGKHADGFVALIAAIAQDAGLPDTYIHTTQKRPRTIPGYFRPCKEWDVAVTSGNDLVAVVEVKSQVGSFGNNFNNRVEEALGNAIDFWTAYKKGLYQPSSRPWVGYLFMLEEHQKSFQPTKRIDLQPFPVDNDFQELSYAKRYEMVCLRLVRELLYDAACFITSNPRDGINGKFDQPNPELGIKNFSISLFARASAFARIKA
ncbi:MAG: restriction endonuclease [SAR324 cluster bacterium]|nr:restriction endonuclease [SAR324 cluster bacterium]